MGLPAYRALGDDGTYVSARVISDATGIDLDLLLRLQRAVGLPRVEDPDAVVQSRVDGESIVHTKALVDLGFETDQVVAIVRVLAEGLHRTAEMIRHAALQAVLTPGATELQLAKAFEVLAQRVAPLLAPITEDLLLLQLRHSFEAGAVNAAERAAGTLPGARQISVAFADLVGFTELGEAVPPEALAQLASRLAELVRSVVVAPVQFVKTIGDAVMLVCSDPAALLDAALDVVAAAAAEGLPHLRVGVASGWAVNRAGDWYGSPVNVASRVTGAAPPGVVLAADSTRAAVGDAKGFVWSAEGSRHLKGVRGKTQLFRAAHRRTNSAS
jgi:adenylate cyclase